MTRTNPLMCQRIALVVVILCCMLFFHTKADYSDLVTWTAVDTTMIAPGRYSICSNSDGRVSAAGRNSGYMFYSHDYAQTWFQTSASCTFLDVECSQTGQYMIAACYTTSYVLISNDYGVSWSESFYASSSWGWYVAISPDGAHMMVAASDSSQISFKLYVSSNYGSTFAVAYTAKSSGAIKVTMDAGRTYLFDSSSSPYKVLQSLNYGQSWTQLTALAVTDATKLINEVQFDDTGMNGFAKSKSLTGSKFTTDGGTTWQLSEFPVGDTCEEVQDIGIGLYNAQYVTVTCYAGYVYSSNDFGATFVANSPVPNFLFSWMDLTSDYEGTFLLVSSYNSLPLYVGRRSMPPTASPTATPVPTVSPSEQPTGPTAEPSTAPSASSIPTLSPSEQPVGPSAAPSTAPSCPSMCPSTTPTINPTERPSLSPTHCPLGSFESSELGCVNCPSNSFTDVLGATTCTCSDGYEPDGFGTGLQCIQCEPGYISLGGANCSACPAGYMAIDLQRSCQICPLNTYAEAAADACTACGPGMLTSAPGATSSSLCLSPAVNFAVGTISLGVILVTACFYIGSGRLTRIARKRRNHVLFPLVDHCQRRAAEIFARTHRKKNNNLSAPVKVFVFIFFGVFVVGVMFVAYYVLYVYIVLINAMILWRGFGYKLDLNFLEALAAYLTLLGRAVGMPIVIDVLFYPLVFLSEKLATLHVNLGSLSVTCDGSQGVGVLLIDLLIFCLAVIFIQADYQIFWSTTLHSVQRCSIQKIISKLASLSNLLERIEKLSVVFLIAMMSLLVNPFQFILRYLMGFVTFNSFFGYSQSTPQCDAMPQARYIDTVLGYATLVLVWLMILPVMYIISNILMPGCHQYVTMRLKSQNYVYLKAPAELVALPYCCFAGRAMTQLQPPETTAEENKTEKTLKAKPILSGKAWFFVFSWLSPDMLLARIADFWVTFLLNRADWKDENSRPANDANLNKIFDPYDMSLSTTVLMNDDISDGSSMRESSNRLIRVTHQHAVYELALTKSDRNRPKPLSRRTNLLYGGMSGMSQTNLDWHDDYEDKLNVRNNSNDPIVAIPVIEGDKSIDTDHHVQQQVMMTTSSNKIEAPLPSAPPENDVASAFNDPNLQQGVAASENKIEAPLPSAPPENDVASAFNDPNLQQGVAASENKHLSESQRSDDFTPYHSINGRHDFPAYMDLCSSEFNELYSLVTAVNSSLFLPVVVQVIFVFVAVYFLGIGHILTVVGRAHLRIILWKFWAFFCVCCGFWGGDNNTVDAFHLCSTWHPGKLKRMRADGSCDVDFDDGQTELSVDRKNVVCVVNDQDECGDRVGVRSNRGDGPAEESVVAMVGDSVVALRNSVTALDDTYMITDSMLAFQIYNGDIRNQNMTRLISAVVGTRAILLMIFWDATLASVYFVLTCETPLFVGSRELRRKLPPLFITSPLLLAEQRERQILVDMWGDDILENTRGRLTGYRRFRAVTRCFIICATQGRFLNWFLNAYTFCLSLLMIMLGTPSISTMLLLLVRLPYILGHATHLFLRFGEILRVDNSDFEQTWSLIRHGFRRQYTVAPLIVPQSTTDITLSEGVDAQNGEVESQP
jgi:hypothetical protein